MQNKRLISVVSGIVCSSIVAGAAIWKVPADAIVGVLRDYFILIGSVLGAYKLAQTITDSEKIKKGDK